MPSSPNREPAQSAAGLQFVPPFRKREPSHPAPALRPLRSAQGRLSGSSSGADCCRAAQSAAQLKSRSDRSGRYIFPCVSPNAAWSPCFSRPLRQDSDCGQNFLLDIVNHCVIVTSIPKPALDRNTRGDSHPLPHTMTPFMPEMLLKIQAVSYDLRRLPWPHPISRAGVTRNAIPFETLVIPASAGIQSVGGAFSMAGGVDSRLRGNDCTWERPCLENDNTTQFLNILNLKELADLGSARGTGWQRDVKNEGTSGDVYENKGEDDKMSCHRAGFLPKFHRFRGNSGRNQRTAGLFGRSAAFRYPWGRAAELQNRTTLLAGCCSGELTSPNGGVPMGSGQVPQPLHQIDPLPGRPWKLE